MGYFTYLKMGVDWGYFTHLLTIDPNFQRDIQVEGNSINSGIGPDWAGISDHTVKYQRCKYGLV